MAAAVPDTGSFMHLTVEQDLSMPITLDDIKTALAIIDNSEGSEVTLRFDDLTLIVRRGEPGATTPLPTMMPSDRAAPVSSAEQGSTPAAPASAQPKSVPSSTSGPPSLTAVPLKAPLSGVIYRAPAPDEPPFVSVGSNVGPEDAVCIIDVMKVMNIVKAPVAGRIARYDAQDGQQVTKGDPILWVDPA